MSDRQKSFVEMLAAMPVQEPSPRDLIAEAIYEAWIEDKPLLHFLGWCDMTEAARAPWRRYADAAIAALTPPPSAEDRPDAG